MKKYIRTKDNIHNQCFKLGGKVVVIGREGSTKNVIINRDKYEERLKTGKYRESDLIEELCDRFVLIDRNEYKEPITKELVGEKYSAMYNELKFRLSTGSDLDKMDLYGAVWTDKGLIYVAKLRTKWEWGLELL